MRIVAIIQARMSSTRLPGKVLKELVGKPVLEHVVERLRSCRLLNEIVVATSVDPSDEVIEKWCTQRQIQCYRGSLTDVLDRYCKAALFTKADAVVRITADCPVIDPVIVDEVITEYINGNFDFFSLKGEFPDGLDCSVFSTSALKQASHEAKLISEREHVGPYIENNPDIFKCGGLEKFHGLHHMRWTLDEPEDYKFLQEIFHRLYKVDRHFYAQEVLDLIAREPALAKINSGILRNEGYLKSLQQDKRVNHV